MTVITYTTEVRGSFARNVADRDDHTTSSERASSFIMTAMTATLAQNATWKGFSYEQKLQYFRERGAETSVLLGIHVHRLLDSRHDKTEIDFLYMHQKRGQRA